MPSTKVVFITLLVFHMKDVTRQLCTNTIMCEHYLKLSFIEKLITLCSEQEELQPNSNHLNRWLS